MRPVLKPLRLGLALLVLAGLTAAFADFRGLLPTRWMHWLAGVQLTPALLATTASVTGLLVLAGLLLLTLTVGRIYCSVICPLGLLQDAIARLRAWLRPRRRPLPVAREAAWLRYSVLGLVTAGAVAGAGGAVFMLADPYGNFGRIVSVLLRPLLVLGNNALVPAAQAGGLNWLYRVPPAFAPLGVLLFAAAFLFVVVALAVWRERIYCNTLCPVGTVLGWLSRHAAFRLAIDQAACTKCAQCLRACKAQCLDLRTSTIDSSRCVACYNCIGACDHDGIGYRFAWRPGSTSAPQPATRPADPERRALMRGALLLAPAAVLHAATIPPSTPPTAEPRAPAAPPGAGSIAHLLDRCTACQLCVSACPTQVLQPAFLDYGLSGLAKPRLDFDRAFCNFECRRCGEVCPTGAIALLDLADKKRTSIGVAKFERTRCIVETDGTDCAACSEHCPTKAVDTVPFRENLRLPQVKEALCIGCGACEYACPVRPHRAITVAARAVHVRTPPAHDTPPAAKLPATDFPF